MTKTTVGKKALGTHNWVELKIEVLATTLITHALTPKEALKLAASLTEMADTCEAHNTAADDEEDFLHPCFDTAE